MVNSAASQNNIVDEIVWVVGDEAIWKSEVEEARLLKEGTPLTYAHYHQEKKGKSPENAPSSIFNKVK